MEDMRYIVVDGVIYFHDQIYLNKESKLKDKLLHAAYEIFLSTPTFFIRTHHIILNGFMWEGFEKDLYQNFQRCMKHEKTGKIHDSVEESIQPPLFLKEKRYIYAPLHLYVEKCW